MLVDQLEHLVLEVGLGNGGLADRKKTSMNETDELFEDNGLVGNVKFGEVVVLGDEMCDEFVDDGQVRGGDDDVHDDNYQFFVGFLAMGVFEAR